MRPVIVIRPQPGCDATLEAARALGLDARGFPLFTVRPVPWEPPAPESVDAILIGSANALRHGGAALGLYRGKPVYAVGDASAEAARDAGLEVVDVGSGGLQSLLDRVRPEHRALLRLAGRNHVPLTAAGDTGLIERVVYASEPLPMPDALADLLRRPALVLLHSAEAGRHFADQCAQHGIDRADISLAAIGPRVAGAVGSGWAAVRSAESPNDAALLALAAEMCQTRGGAIAKDTPDSPMQDEYTTQTSPPRRSGKGTLLVAFLAFLAGAALVGWLAWRGDLRLSTGSPGDTATATSAASTPAALTEAIASPSSEVKVYDPLGTVETRLALLEERLSRLDTQADAASGNAARAEGLLIAFAARRLVDKGAPLGFLEDQLKLRFANAQPLAVDTIVTFAKEPVTVDQLSTQLDVLAPDLAGGEDRATGWSRIKEELGNLFVVRRDSGPSRKPEDRIARVKLLLATGRIDRAIEEVQRLPNAEAAQDWIASARRYAAAQRALDLIETTAMLEPRRLQDSAGRKVDQPSPLAEPADKDAAKQGTPTKAAPGKPG